MTGTEVLSGIITDRNGPWLSQQLFALGVDTATIQIVGDRPADLRRALEDMRAAGVGLIVTSGGLGPTADDLTADVVGSFCGREMVLDPALETRISEILAQMLARWPNLDPDAIRRSNRKQAVIPRGATVLDPVGTAPGLVVTPLHGEGPTVVVLPGPPRELRPMWLQALETQALRAAIGTAVPYEFEIVRLFGIPESEIAATLRAAEHGAGLDLTALEITTCLRRGEIEVATRFTPDARPAYDALLDLLRERHGDTLFSQDGSTIDWILADQLRGHTLAVAESCTAGGLASRLTDPPGASDYFLGGAVVYSNRAKTDLAGVQPALIDRHGAVSTEVAQALARGIAQRFGAELGVGITGIAGPGGGTSEKPVGLVCLSVWRRGEPPVSLTRRARLPGDRADVRDRSVTVAMHMLRRVLLGESDPAG